MKMEFKSLNDGDFFKLDGLLFKKDDCTGLLEDGKRLFVKPNTIVDFDEELNVTE